MMTAIVIAVAVVLLICGTPLFAVMALLTGALIVIDGSIPLSVVVQQFLSVAERSELVAIPLFILVSVMMTRGRSARELVGFLKAVVSRLPGGLPLTVILGCIVFASIAGLSPAAIIAIGTMMYPGLVKAGYPEKFALGLVTSAGGLGILVPPSIVVLVFGIVGEVNIESLFIAAVVPVVIIVSAFAAYCIAKWKRGDAEHIPGETWRTFRSGFWAIMLPVVVGGGIFSGRLNIIQAAACATVYTFLIECLIYRTIKLRDMSGIIREAGSMTGMLLIIIAVTMSFNWFLTVRGIPYEITEHIVSVFSSPVTFLLAVNVLLLFLGCMMDILSAVFITVPLLLPAAMQMGISPVHFGIIFIINFEIGYLTPPVGLNLFTAGAVFKKPVNEVARAAAPFLLILLAVLLAVTYVPQLSLWLPQIFGKL